MESLEFGRVLGAVTVLALTAGIVLEVAHTASPLSYAARGRAPTVATPFGGPINWYPPGVPAITPTLPRNPANPAQPTFTTDDVRRYFLAHPLQTVDGPTPQIVRIAFMPASQASALVNGEWIGRPPTALVCFVEVNGNLSRGSMSVPPGATQLLQAASHDAQFVFDGYTGNVLLSRLSVY